MCQDVGDIIFPFRATQAAPDSLMVGQRSAGHSAVGISIWPHPILGSVRGFCNLQPAPAPVSVDFAQQELFPRPISSNKLDCTIMAVTKQQANHITVENFEKSQDFLEYKVHSNLVSSSHLVRVLENRLPADSFTLEMRHSVYIIRVKRSCLAKA